MWLLGFYRLYISLCAGIAIYVFIFRSLRLLFVTAIVVRGLWFGLEKIIELILINRDFSRHIYSFKQELGPYGILLANRAEKDRRIKKSLAEVFTSNTARLKKNVDQLKVIDTLYKAGMRPDTDAYQLHDCKMKYGSFRLEQMEKSGRS